MRTKDQYRVRWMTIPFDEPFELPNRLSKIIGSKFHEGGGCDLLILEWSEWKDEDGRYVWDDS